jgi:hypothetical protein
MNFWNRRPERAPALGEPSPLLRHLAGEFAPRVAGYWPAPHAAFLTAPAPRRHLVCLALTGAKGHALSEPDQLLELSLGKAVTAHVPQPPAGLKRALEHMGEQAWAEADYKRLLVVLDRGGSAKALRHADHLAQTHVRALADLPQPLLQARVGEFGLSEQQALLLSEAYALLIDKQGAEASQAILLRWAGATSAKTLFPRVMDDLWPELPQHPFPGTVKLVPLATKVAVRDAALRYRNCLRYQMRYAVTGESAFFEWTEGAGAIVRIWHDPFYGWRLCEARMARNAAVPPAIREAIKAELSSMGVHVGRPYWQLENALESAHEPGFVMPDAKEAVDEMFTD